MCSTNIGVAARRVHSWFSQTSQTGPKIQRRAQAELIQVYVMVKIQNFQILKFTQKVHFNWTEKKKIFIWLKQ